MASVLKIVREDKNNNTFGGCLKIGHDELKLYFFQTKIFNFKTELFSKLNCFLKIIIQTFRTVPQDFVSGCTLKFNFSALFNVTIRLLSKKG
jgi:hypothetical protein